MSPNEQDRCCATACDLTYLTVPDTSRAFADEGSRPLFQNSVTSVGEWGVCQRLYKLPWLAATNTEPAFRHWLRPAPTNALRKDWGDEAVSHLAGRGSRSRQQSNFQEFLRLVLSTVPESCDRRCPECFPLGRWSGAVRIQVPHRNGLQSEQQAKVRYLEHRWPDRLQRDSQVRYPAIESMGLLLEQGDTGWCLQRKMGPPQADMPLVLKCTDRCLRQLCHLWIL